MSLKEIAEDVVPGVAPAKLILGAIAGVLVCAILAWAGWKLFFAERAAQTKHDQVQLQAAQGMGQAATQSGHDAIKITVDNGKAAAGIDAAVKGALNEIAHAKGADASVSDEVDDAGRRAVCVRFSAAGLPECQSLQRSGAR